MAEFQQIEYRFCRIWQLLRQLNSSTNKQINKSTVGKKNLMKIIRIFTLLIFLNSMGLLTYSQTSVRIGLLKYAGGGDWYSNPTSLPNLIDFCNKNIGTNIDPEPVTVDVGSPEIFNSRIAHNLIALFSCLSFFDNVLKYKDFRNIFIA